MPIKTVTIFGTSRARVGDPVYSLALETGRLLARSGYAIANGGYGGTMLAAAQGACEARGEIIEPLHEPQHADTAGRINGRGMKLAPAIEAFENIDTNTWGFWIHALLDSGLAKIVDGAVPAFDASKAKKQFITVNPDDPILRLTAAIEAQTELLTKLLTK